MKPKQAAALFEEMDPNFAAGFLGRMRPDAAAAKRWEALVDEARKAGSSLGAVVECVATGVPAGWGAPIYAKLDADLAAGMMSINAVKGVEIGDGFGAARLAGLFARPTAWRGLVATVMLGLAVALAAG